VIDRNLSFGGVSRHNDTAKGIDLSIVFGYSFLTGRRLLASTTGSEKNRQNYDTEEEDPGVSHAPVYTGCRF
jgi:hypothetical protein